MTDLTDSYPDTIWDRIRGYAAPALGMWHNSEDALAHANEQFNQRASGDLQRLGVNADPDTVNLMTTLIGGVRAPTRTPKSPNPIRRALSQGYLPEMPLHYADAPGNEAIASAALNVNGRIFPGQTHGDAMLAAERALGVPFEDMQHAPILDGFITTSGRYVSRWEAGDIAKRQAQGETGGIFGAARGLASEDVKPASDRASSAASYRIGATETGLPGGQGIWLSLAPQDAGPAAALWHRTRRPALMEAAGVPDHEIQASLKDAWEQGHDSVMLRNYTRPGGKTPEDVVVVRSPSQLRSPRAAFNPNRMDSPNLLAALSGLSLLPFWSPEIIEILRKYGIIAPTAAASMLAHAGSGDQQ